MTGVLTLYRSSIGKKAIMAISGLAGIGFLVLHMYGNLKVFEGPEYFNNYAAGLRTLGAPVFGYSHLLWIARLGLIAAIVLHVMAAYQLTRQDWAGRPRQNRYVQKKDVQATYASRTMRWGGVILLLFIVYHILNLTLGVVGYYGAGAYQPEDAGGFHAYSNVVNSFQFWPASIFYIVAMLALGLHVYHGFWSMFQTLGLNTFRTNGVIRILAGAVALVLVLGFIAVPLAVMFGIVQ
jgi:succinate dehydrogenase / fumarate reductase cytochrome b subunit